MPVSEPLEQFDLVVVGSGKGGKTLAIDLAKQGYKAALIERDPDRIGGTYINVACIPTKTLVQGASVPPVRPCSHSSAFCQSTDWKLARRSRGASSRRRNPLARDRSAR